MDIFEKIGKKITNAGQNVAQQTKNLSDVTQLNFTISSLEKKISQILQELGTAYYENHKNDESAENYEKIAEINKIYAEIAENNEKIKQIKGVAKCDTCGAEVPANSSFCSSCGAKINHTENNVAVEENTSICPNCNASVQEGNAFCTNCGTKLETGNE